MLTYLITGANRGLGLELTRQLRARGERVFATARAPRDAGELRKLTPDVLALDAAEPASIESLGAAMKGQAVDVLINNAGIYGKDTSLDALSAAEFERVFRTNVAGPALITRALLPSLRGGRRKLVVNVSSTYGSISSSISGGSSGGSWSYKSSKAALNMVTSDLHNALKPEGFTCVSVCPGWNRTDMGGSGAPLDPRDSMRSLIGVMDRLSVSDSGRFLNHEGSPIAW